MSEVRFYRANGAYGFFSNFARYPIELDGKVWPTVEHYYQAQKFLDPEIQEKVRQAKHPGQAFRIGNDRSLPLRDDWKDIKVVIMHKAVSAKFQQHPGLREELLNTCNAKLVEHTERDRFWGDGGDGSGKNMLGQILMSVREELRYQ